MTFFSSKEGHLIGVGAFHSLLHYSVYFLLFSRSLTGQKTFHFRGWVTSKFHLCKRQKAAHYVVFLLNQHYPIMVKEQGSQVHTLTCSHRARSMWCTACTADVTQK